MASPAALTGTPSIPAPQAQLGQAEIRAIVYGLMTAMLLAALDQTIVATAMPTIGLALGDAANLPWIVTAYLLASTAVTPLYGKLSDIHGRRIMLLIAITTFVLGSVACALAPTMVGLALARGLQGIGGGGLIALSQTILADIMSPKERARYQVVIAGVFVAASVAGPLLALQLRFWRGSDSLRHHDLRIMDVGGLDRGDAGALGLFAAGGEGAHAASVHPGPDRRLGRCFPGRTARRGAAQDRLDAG